MATKENATLPATKPDPVRSIRLDDTPVEEADEVEG